MPSFNTQATQTDQTVEQYIAVDTTHQNENENGDGLPPLLRHLSPPSPYDSWLSLAEAAVAATEAAAAIAGVAEGAEGVEAAEAEAASTSSAAATLFSPPPYSLPAPPPTYRTFDPHFPPSRDFLQHLLHLSEPSPPQSAVAIAVALEHELNNDPEFLRMHMGIFSDLESRLEAPSEGEGEGEEGDGEPLLTPEDRQGRRERSRLTRSRRKRRTTRTTTRIPTRTQTRMQKVITTAIDVVIVAILFAFVSLAWLAMWWMFIWRGSLT